MRCDSQITDITPLVYLPYIDPPGPPDTVSTMPAQNENELEASHIRLAVNVFFVSITSQACAKEHADRRRRRRRIPGSRGRECSLTCRRRLPSPNGVSHGPGERIAKRQRCQCLWASCTQRRHPNPPLTSTYLMPTTVRQQYLYEPSASASHPGGGSPRLLLLCQSVIP